MIRDNIEYSILSMQEKESVRRGVRENFICPHIPFTSVALYRHDANSLLSGIPLQYKPCVCNTDTIRGVPSYKYLHMNKVFRSKIAAAVNRAVTLFNLKSDKYYHVVFQYEEALSICLEEE